MDREETAGSDKRKNAARGKMPQDWGTLGWATLTASLVSAPSGPNIVCVFPDPVWPYASTVEFLLFARWERMGAPRVL
jgi:hypothetical protein